jgi:monoamine oxidase
MERRRRAAEHYERARDVLPLDLITAPPRAGASAGQVAIVGAGFAGCAAAWVAKDRGFDVTIYDAVGKAGGRVRSSSKVVQGRILEEGAELIGLNHPFWIVLADMAGLALGVVTPEDEQGGGHLNSPLILDGNSYDPQAQEQLYAGMKEVFDLWVEQSAVVTQPWAPWTMPSAQTLDSQSLGQQIPPGTRPDGIAAIDRSRRNSS